MSKNKNYFNKDTEQAIIEYNSEESVNKKNRIFTEKIYPIFDMLMSKLAQKKINKNILYDTGYTLDDIIVEGITHLYTNCLHNYNPESGAAFSYFTRSSINYLSRRQIDIRNEKLQYADIDTVDFHRDVYVELERSNYTDNLFEFINDFIIFYESHMYDMYANDEIKIVNGFLEVFKTREQIQIYYKKALYILIREITGLPTQKITPVIKKIYQDFWYLYHYYNEHNTFNYDDFIQNRMDYKCKPKT